MTWCGPADRSAPATQRFERERFRELWQMDFKGQKENKESRAFTVGAIRGLNCSSLFLQEKRHITKLLRSY
jgi:hypothetical protein